MGEERVKEDRRISNVVPSALALSETLTPAPQVFELPVVTDPVEVLVVDAAVVAAAVVAVVAVVAAVVAVVAVVTPEGAAIRS